MPHADATKLREALARMTYRVEPGSFALFGFADPPAPEDLALLAREPAQIVREGGETTLLVRAEEGAGVRARHPEAAVESDLVWIRFEAPMDWELVGFLAVVCGHLAEAGVPLGAVCGYSRDHLFVAAKHLERARRALSALFPEVSA